MTLSIYNTASRKIEPFTPTGDTVKIYTCGPTVYDYPHIGNWVAYIYWDILIRTLIVSGHEVKRVMNITDVGHLVSDGDDGEDKLEKGARREGKSAWDIAQFYTEDFIVGMEKLNLLPPENIARATDYIPEQLELVRTLQEKGYTYQISDGIYFDTARFSRYADFAQLQTGKQKAGTRVEFNPEKRQSSDFALWKFSPSGVKRDMEWETPSDILENGSKEIKMGFPGWHLECSAIAMKFFGASLDIHTGGIDHIQVHHTNEIAQSEAATNQVFSRYWLHNNHMKVDGSKISKSLSNGYTLHDIESKGFDPLDFRLLVLQSHFQTESNFSFESLQAAKRRRLHWRQLAALRWQAKSTDNHNTRAVIKEVKAGIMNALDNNLDTTEALRIIDQVFTELENMNLADLEKTSLEHCFKILDDLLGLQLLSSTPDITDEIKQLIARREQARTDKSWDKSDELRDELLGQGVAIRDTPSGSVWSYA